MNAIRNTLPIPTRRASVAHLSISGLDLFQRPTRPKQTHWNVLAPTFIRLHLLDELGVTMNQFRRSAKTTPAFGESHICQQQPST
jgi:DNA-binding ferritin-like protein